METEGMLRLADLFASVEDPRQAAKVEHDLVDLLVVAVNTVLVGADTCLEIELWAREKLHWLRGYLRLAYGIPFHDTHNLIRLDPIKRKGGLKARRLIAATSDTYRAELIGLG